LRREAENLIQGKGPENKGDASNYENKERHALNG
jgi:hypothetical protein